MKKIFLDISLKDILNIKHPQPALEMMNIGEMHFELYAEKEPVVYGFINECVPNIRNEEYVTPHLNTVYKRVLIEIVDEHNRIFVLKTDGKSIYLQGDRSQSGKKSLNTLNALCILLLSD